MAEDDFKTEMFIQHWEHTRHLESYRMWIMGIWLGVSGVLLKEIWINEKTETWCLQTLIILFGAHLIVTIAVLLTILKLQLELSKHHIFICKTAKEKGESETRFFSVWKIIDGEQESLIHKWFFTVGGISSALLIIGISFDLYFILCPILKYLFVCDLWCPLGYPFIWIGICIVIFVVFQKIFESYQKKLKQELNNNKKQPLLQQQNLQDDAPTKQN